MDTPCLARGTLVGAARTSWGDVVVSGRNYWRFTSRASSFSQTCVCWSRVCRDTSPMPPVDRARRDPTTPWSDGPAQCPVEHRRDERSPDVEHAHQRAPFAFQHEGNLGHWIERIGIVLPECECHGRCRHRGGHRLHLVAVLFDGGEDVGVRRTRARVWDRRTTWHSRR